MLVKGERNTFVVNWDLGRRCTYACSYCPPFRSNKTSPLVSLDDMIKTMEFIDEYVTMYDHYMNYQEITISLTGGEPTVHPALYKFAKHVKETYGTKYRLDLTTNGAWKRKNINELFDSGTISYHPEAEPDIKKQVRDNIASLRWKVNVMFHKDYFDECIDLCNWLDELGIKYIPRRIGETGGKNREESIAKGWVQEYNEEQEQWFADYYGVKGSGRKCCGGRCIEDENGPIEFIKDPNFYGWSCAINWYFLFINQELGDVWTHQTCSVNLNSQVDKLGSLNNTDQILDDLDRMLYTEKTIPVITCPKTSCLCGICIDKGPFEFVKSRLPEQISYTESTPVETIKWVTPFNEHL